MKRTRSVSGQTGLVYAILFGDQFRKIVQAANELAYIAHFVVIPADSFDQLLVSIGDDTGLSGIVQRAITNADDVAAYDLVFGITKAFVGGGLHSGIDLFEGNFLLQNGNQLGEGTGEGWNTLSTTIQFT